MGVVSAAAWVWCRVVKKKEKKPPTGRGKPNPGPNIKTGASPHGRVLLRIRQNPSGLMAQGLRALAYTMGCNTATPTPGAVSAQARSASA